MELGLLELIGRYDPSIADHLNKVKEAQTEKKRMQVHYLSPDIQNEFLAVCAKFVLHVIQESILEAVHYSVIFDGSPDNSHMERNSLVIRYVSVNKNTKEYNIYERFVEFYDCSSKTGQVLAAFIQGALEKINIPIENCRGQGYDNAFNMSGKYGGCQAEIKKINPLAVFSPCGGHNLNLSGEDALNCCTAAVTFFGPIQKVYEIFSGLPQRWEIVVKHIRGSLYSQSKTRWSTKVESVEPIATNIEGVLAAIEELEESQLKPEVRVKLLGIKKYFRTFEFVLLSNLWLKVLTQINYVQTIIQGRETTLTVEAANVKSLIEALHKIQDNWEEILEEARSYAATLNIELKFEEKRKTCPYPKYFDKIENESSAETKFKT